MSLEKAKELISTMNHDEAFKERVMAIEDLDARMAYVNGAGFHCTLSEIQQVQQELKEEEIEGEAGGNMLWCQALGWCKHHKTSTCNVQ
jgi:predicted ribosomally synthesized peptide with nif11-like leader